MEERLPSRRKRNAAIFVPLAALWLVLDIATKAYFNGFSVGRRQFLHSYSIAFEHPTTGEPMAFADNLPRDLQEALDSLAARSLGKTEAGREVAELMATSPVPSVEGEVPDE